MRAIRLVLVLVSCLLLASCDNPGSKAKAPGELKAPEVIVGKWVGKKDGQGGDSYIGSYEFGTDHSVRVMCLNAEKPITGKYQFTNDYTLQLEYEGTSESRKAFAEAAKAFRMSAADTAIKDKGGAARSQIPNELPAKEILTINVRSVPAVGGGSGAPAHPAIELILTNEKGISHIFRKQPGNE
jgi:hypothetical protein